MAATTRFAGHRLEFSSKTGPAEPARLYATAPLSIVSSSEEAEQYRKNTMPQDGTPAGLGAFAFENAPIGIVMTESRVIRTCNPAFAEMFRYSRDELVEQSFALLYPSIEEFTRIGP